MGRKTVKNQGMLNGITHLTKNESVNMIEAQCTGLLRRRVLNPVICGGVFMVKEIAFRGKQILLVVFAFAFLLSNSKSVWALTDSDRIRELEQKLQESMKTIDKLSEKMKVLEEKLEQQKSVTDKIKETQTASAPAVEQEAAPIPTGTPSLNEIAPIHGFADVGFGMNSKRKDPDTKLRGFAVGDVILYLAPRLTDRSKAFIELSVMHDEQGNVNVDTERLYYEYNFNNLANARIGRFSTPLGYWNTLYTHAALFQTSILRPVFLDEDKGVLPVHQTGLEFFGAKNIGSGKLGYDFYLSNGARVTNVTAGDGKLDFSDLKDYSNVFTIGTNISYEFGDALEGLRLGGHYLRSKVPSFDANNNPLNQTELNILGGYVLYNNFGWEGLGEYYQFLDKNTDGNTGSHSSWAGVVQLGHSIGKFLPYARLEKAHFDQADNYFSQLKNGQSYDREALGIRYDLSPKVAIKLEGNHTKVSDRNLESYNEIRLQFATGF